MAQTSETIEIISGFLEDELAPRVQMHGVLLDVFSLGTLIVGDAGIGKSECALELIYRGHRLVADDLVIVRRTHNRGLVGSPHDLLQNYLELRGVGIIDIRKHFGMTATQPSVTISLVIQLIKLSSGAKALEQKWREQMMERPRAWTSTETILGMEIPKYTMVVAPGRDVAIMVETAVRKCLLAQRGIQDERDFLDVVNQLAQGSPMAENLFGGPFVITGLSGSGKTVCLGRLKISDICASITSPSNSSVRFSRPLMGTSNDSRSCLMFERREWPRNFQRSFAISSSAIRG